MKKEVFKEDNVSEKTANNEKPNDKKDLKTNDSNFEKDSTHKSKVDKQKEKLDQSDKKNLKRFSNNQNDKTNFPNPPPTPTPAGSPRRGGGGHFGGDMSHNIFMILFKFLD